MSYLFETATPDHIVGRVVGEGELSNWIAVAVIPHKSSPKSGYLLAVRRDGQEYVTWAWGLNIAETRLNCWWGRYFLVEHYDSAGDAFDAACENLKLRAQGGMP